MPYAHNRIDTVLWVFCSLLSTVAHTHTHTHTVYTNTSSTLSPHQTVAIYYSNCSILERLCLNLNFLLLVFSSCQFISVLVLVSVFLCFIRFESELICNVWIFRLGVREIGICSPSAQNIRLHRVHIIYTEGGEWEEANISCCFPV